MIYIIGNTHIPFDVSPKKTMRFPAQKNLTADDYLIICGDFGDVWCEDTCTSVRLSLTFRKKLG